MSHKPWNANSPLLAFMAPGCTAGTSFGRRENEKSKNVDNFGFGFGPDGLARAGG